MHPAKSSRDHSEARTFAGRTLGKKLRNSVDIVSDRGVAGRARIDELRRAWEISNDSQYARGIVDDASADVSPLVFAKE